MWLPSELAAPGALAAKVDLTRNVAAAATLRAAPVDHLTGAEAVGLDHAGPAADCEADDRAPWRASAGLRSLHQPTKAPGEAGVDDLGVRADFGPLMQRGGVDHLPLPILVEQVLRRNYARQLVAKVVPVAQGHHPHAVLVDAPSRGVLSLRGVGYPTMGHRELVTRTSGCAAKQRRRSKLSLVGDLKHDLNAAEHELLVQLRFLRRNLRSEAAAAFGKHELTFGQRIADAVAATMGSWPFIIVQSAILAAWIALNITAYVHKWDPYPFILLNLALSFQAAYAAPFIMMSQNRQQDVDRKEAAEDHKINIKAELEIELLHQKIDALREKEVLMLTQAISDLTELLKREQAQAHNPNL
jgi:uncharacterized membrane protein